MKRLEYMSKATLPPINWLAAVVLLTTPVIALIAVPWYGIVHGFGAAHWAVFVLLVALNGLSITAGYHRLWAHRAYNAHPALRWLLALFGAAATQNSILVWASGHRRHHRHVDDNEHDPYSARKGFWFSHMGWMLRHYPAGRDDFSNARDLQNDPVVAFQHRYYIPLALIMNFTPPLLAGLLLGDMLGHFLLGGVLRLVVSHHVTFFINSLAHMWGRRPYTDTNTARDNGWLALVTYGEGYHNFHHMFQHDYRNGVRWYQYDPTKWLIYAASKIGLASDLKRVEPFRIQQALLDMQFKRAQERLQRAGNADAWRDHLEREYQQFLSFLQEWNQIRQHWYEQKLQRLAEKTAELQRNWQQTTMNARLKELEYAMRLQRKRLRHMILQLA
ncbi:MAG: fatty acid desaturase [Spongiibacteraceae bacterium]|jgi:stearoyl-CoA desaturase (delta-9 desaturase)|nr:fatty acid desaturase [Spongiibacteraceae bacterium]